MKTISDGVATSIIIPHVKIVSRDRLTKVGHSIMSTGEMSTTKTSTILTGSTGSYCCFHWYFTKLGFVRYNKINMPCQCGYPDGMSPLGRMAPPEGKPSSLWETFHQDTHTGMAYLYNGQHFEIPLLLYAQRQLPWQYRKQYKYTGVLTMNIVKRIPIQD